MKNPKKILIVRLSAIGDVIHSLPILHCLKRKYPDVSIGWVVEDKAADILEGHPLVDKVFVMPRKKWKKRVFSLKNLVEFIKFIGEIRKEKFDIAIDLQELFKSAIVTFLSGAKRRIAHDKTREFADLFVNEKIKAHDIFDPDKPIIERYLEPAGYLEAPIDEIKFCLPPSDSKTIEYVDGLFSGIDSKKPVIVFSPATIWSSKHWVEEYWSELLDNLADDNNIIFTGTPNDIELIKRITAKAKTGKYTILAGKTDIKQLIEVFNRTDIVVAPDTGPAHIANATEKPDIICIFGSTSYKRSTPYGSRHEAISANISCQPCFKRICPKKDFPLECVYKITSEGITSLIEKKLQKKL